MAIALSVLDQCPVPSGSTAAAALGDSVQLAVSAERLGYRRYWAAEHHNTPSLGSTSPEILVAAVAARTNTIRVGSGGVLLSHYSPLKVAETFRMLDALSPGRVDLGVGRATGPTAATEAALLYGAHGDETFPRKLVDLLGFLDGALEDGHPFGGVRALPDGTAGPEVWVLGSSAQGAGYAAQLGLPFSFAHFITAHLGSAVMNTYARRFQPSSRSGRPLGNVAVSVVCADTDAEAQRLARSVDVWRLQPEGAERGPLLPPEEAAMVALTDVERVRVAQNRAAMVVGAPEPVRARLVELAREFTVDELVVVTVCHDPRARLRSYELLAESFALPVPGEM